MFMWMRTTKSKKKLFRIRKDWFVYVIWIWRTIPRQISLCCCKRFDLAAYSLTFYQRLQYIYTCSFVRSFIHSFHIRMFRRFALSCKMAIPYCTHRTRAISFQSFKVYKYVKMSVLFTIQFCIRFCSLLARLGWLLFHILLGISICRNQKISHATETIGGEELIWTYHLVGKCDMNILVNRSCCNSITIESLNAWQGAFILPFSMNHKILTERRRDEEAERTRVAMYNTFYSLHAAKDGDHESYDIILWLRYRTNESTEDGSFSVAFNT